MRAGGRTLSKHCCKERMCDDCQPKEPHARSAAGNLLKICGNAYYEGFENIIVQYD